MIYTVTLNSFENHFGKGINISLLLKKLNIDSIATGIIANNIDKISNTLDNKGIKHHFVFQKQEQQLDLFASAAIKISAKTQQKLLKYLKQIKMGDILIVAGDFANGIDPIYMEDLAELAAKKRAHFVIDVPYVNVRDILPLHPLLVRTNEANLKSWFNKGNEQIDQDDLINLGHDLVVKGADHVLLSLGDNGAAIINLMHAYIANAPSVQLINEYGASATLLASFLAGILKNYAPVRNLADSIAAAADTVQNEETTNFTDLVELQKQVSARKITFQEAE